MKTSAYTRRHAIAVVAAAFTLALGSLTGCGSPAADNVLTVAASPAPHAQILNDFVAPKLKEQGIDLKVNEYTDYILPNKDTSSGAVDVNYFQHVNYLNDYNKENGTDLVPVAAVHFEPMAVYAGASQDLSNIRDGATFAIPNDPTNEGRALLLLQDQGLITLKKADTLTATPKDIKDNPHNLKFQELEAAAIPRALGSVDFAVINGNYAIEAGYHVKDALAREEAGSVAVDQYANILCVEPAKKDDDKVRALSEILTSEEFGDYLSKNYGEDVLPAF